MDLRSLQHLQRRCHLKHGEKQETRGFNSAIITKQRSSAYTPAMRIPEARHSKTLRRASPAPMGRFPVPMAFSQISSRGYTPGERGRRCTRRLFLSLASAQRDSRSPRKRASLQFNRAGGGLLVCIQADKCLSKRS